MSVQRLAGMIRSLVVRFWYGNVQSISSNKDIRLGDHLWVAEYSWDDRRGKGGGGSLVTCAIGLSSDAGYNPNFLFRRAIQQVSRKAWRP